MLTNNYLTGWQNSTSVSNKRTLFSFAYQLSALYSGFTLIFYGNILPYYILSELVEKRFYQILIKSRHNSCSSFIHSIINEPYLKKYSTIKSTMLSVQLKKFEKLNPEKTTRTSTFLMKTMFLRSSSATRLI